MSYAEHNNVEVLRAALALARGCYQRNLLMGREALSGATLRGRAKQYSGRYRDSADNLLRRCRQAGLPITEVRREHNKRVLRIGEPAQ